MENKIINVFVPCDVITEEYNNVPSISSISHFTLKPSSCGDWETKIVNNSGNRVSLSGFTLEFESPADKYKELEVLQSAILKVEIDHSSAHWKFVGKGIIVTGQQRETNFDLSSEVSCDGKKLKILINKVGDTGSTRRGIKFIDVSFLYVAARVDIGSGKETVYLSQDPSVGIGRPIGS